MPYDPDAKATTREGGPGAATTDPRPLPVSRDRALDRVLSSRALAEHLDGLRQLVPTGVTVTLRRGTASPADNPAGAVAILPLNLSGERVADLVLEGPAARPDEPWARLCAKVIETFVEERLTQRKVVAETLDSYRELVGLQRAALAFGRTLRQSEVAEALLGELGQRTRAPGAALILLAPDPAGEPDMFALLAQAATSDLARSAPDLARLTSAPGFAAALSRGRGEIVNTPEENPDWAGAFPGAGAILVAPFVADGERLGALVLAHAAGGDTFAAADLSHAATLASMAAVVFRNARLFEKVLEVKSYNETVLQSLSSGVVTLDAKGAVVTANAAALEMLGLGEADAIGQNAATIWRGANAWVLDDAAAAMGGAEARASVDRSLEAADGRVTSVNLVARPLPAVADGRHGAVLMFENITPEKRLKGTMARFMSDAVVDRLLTAADARLGGDVQEVSILFADIRGFTRLAEGLEARRLVATLNEHFAEMVDSVFENGGTLDKFIGDGLMAVFGAPFPSKEDPDRAVAAAVDMVRRARAENARRSHAGSGVLELCVGINTGEVVAGTIGSPRRMDYTVIGDHVNLAARIEKANRYFGTRILISEHTTARLARDWTLRELDRVRVAGRVQPVRLFEVLDHHDPADFPRMDELRAAFAEGLKAYRARDWREGARFFAEALRASPDDRPTQIFLHRCWTHTGRPPDAAWTDVADLAELGR